MKTRCLKLMLAVLLGLMLSQDALGFYNSSTGRWLARDPLDELGFDPVATNRKNLRDAKEELFVSALLHKTHYVSRSSENSFLNWLHEEKSLEMFDDYGFREPQNVRVSIFDAELNPYTFVNNNSITSVDHLGLLIVKFTCDSAQWRVCALSCMAGGQVVGKCFGFQWIKWYERPPPGHAKTVRLITICICTGCWNGIT